MTVHTEAARGQEEEQRKKSRTHDCPAVSHARRRATVKALNCPRYAALRKRWGRMGGGEETQRERPKTSGLGHDDNI